MSPGAELRLKIRNPKATAQMLGNALRRYLKARQQPYKPLGDGDMLVVNTKGQLRMMTRPEYGEMVHARKRKPKRKKGEADPVMFAYDSISDKRVEARLHAPMLDAEHVGDMAWIDALARRHELELEADAYHGEW